MNQETSIRIGQDTVTEATMKVTVIHNATAQRFEADLGGQVAVAAYRRHGDTIYFTHTETPVAYRGRGIAAQVVQFGLEYAKAEGLTVVPLCGFVAGYIAEHPEYQSITR